MLIYSLGKLEMDLLVLLILILLVIWIREDHSQVMFSPLVVVLWVREQLCSLLWLVPLLMPSIWLFLRHAKKLSGWEVCTLSFVEIHLALPYFLTVKVPYILQRIQCIMRGQSTLMSNFIIFKMLYDNPADMMTKPVPTNKFEFCSGLIGISH